MGSDKKLLTTREYSERTGIPVSEVARRLRQGRLEGRKRSGRWWIPVSALDEAPSASAARGRNDAPAPAAPRTLSVAEFSELTYLTETGVLQWLKRGRLKGRRSEDGRWEVDADNLETADVRRLLR
jgi:hypothetical protein